MTRINRKDIMEQVRDDDGRVIGGYWYAPKADVFVCESVHQQVSHIAHSEADAEQWLRDNDQRRRRPRGLRATVVGVLLRWADR